MLKDLIKVSNSLDLKGFRKEADELDRIIRKLAQTRPPEQAGQHYASTGADDWMYFVGMSGKVYASKKDKEDWKHVPEGTKAYRSIMGQINAQTGPRLVPVTPHAETPVAPAAEEAPFAKGSIPVRWKPVGTLYRGSNDPGYYLVAKNGGIYSSPNNSDWTWHKRDTEEYKEIKEKIDNKTLLPYNPAVDELRDLADKIRRENVGKQWDSNQGEERLREAADLLSDDQENFINTIKNKANPWQNVLKRIERRIKALQQTAKANASDDALFAEASRKEKRISKIASLLSGEFNGLAKSVRR